MILYNNAMIRNFMDQNMHEHYDLLPQCRFSMNVHRTINACLDPERWDTVYEFIEEMLIPGFVYRDIRLEFVDSIISNLNGRMSNEISE